MLGSSCGIMLRTRGLRKEVRILRAMAVNISFKLQLIMQLKQSMSCILKADTSATSTTRYFVWDMALSLENMPMARGEILMGINILSMKMALF